MIQFYAYGRQGQERPVGRQEVGLLPTFFDETSPRAASEQLDETYAHGGGFMAFDGMELSDWDRPGHALMRYLGDPPIHEVARASLSSELLILFDGDWLAIVQPGGAYIVTRVD